MNNFILSSYSEFAEKAKLFASNFNPCVILDSCSISPILGKGKYKLIIGFGGNQIIEPKQNKLDALYASWLKDKKWIFGVLGYELKNEIEKLTSHNNKIFDWPELCFFVPKTIITVNWENELTIYSEFPSDIYAKIINTQKYENLGALIRNKNGVSFDFNSINHSSTIRDIKTEIRNGNVYELNLCSRFLLQNTSISDCYQLFDELICISPAPFSAFVSFNNKFILSASPERYLRKVNSELLSQPIKGTRPRGKDKYKDNELRNNLSNNSKDKAENVMIVDLVRNDLARVSKPGTVKADELFGIYSYSHVHQMVSTISSQMDDEFSWKDAIKASFPMGSMTGTPKIAAMKWIEKFELSAREWYSGALGYVDPEGNFDFNVLIRSLFYDSDKKILAYYAGGAITIDSLPEEEFEEMMVKAKAIESLLQLHKKD